MDERHLKYGIEMDAVVGQDILKPNKNILVKRYVDVDMHGGRLSTSNESYQFAMIYFDDLWFLLWRQEILIAHAPNLAPRLKIGRHLQNAGIYTMFLNERLK